MQPRANVSNALQPVANNSALVVSTPIQNRQIEILGQVVRNAINFFSSSAPSYQNVLNFFSSNPIFKINGKNIALCLRPHLQIPRQIPAIFYPEGHNHIGAKRPETHAIPTNCSILTRSAKLCLFGKDRITNQIIKYIYNQGVRFENERPLPPCRQTAINDLPNELLYDILRRVDSQSMLSFTLVLAKSNEILRKKCVKAQFGWKSFEITKESTQEYMTFVKKHEFCTPLSFCESNDLIEFIDNPNNHDFLQHLPKLNCHLDNPHITSNELNHLFSKVPNITSFSSNFCITGMQWQVIQLPLKLCSFICDAISAGIIIEDNNNLKLIHVEYINHKIRLQRLEKLEVITIYTACHSGHLCLQELNSLKRLVCDNIELGFIATIDEEIKKSVSKCSF